MNSKTTLPISEARKKIFEIAEAVQKSGVYYTLTDKGRPKVVILSYEEYDSLMENLEIFSDPATLAKMKKAEVEFERGDYVSWEEAKKQLGWQALEPSLVMEKAKKTYQVKTKKKKE